MDSTAARLIVNADDFGRSPSINAAIVAAHRDGILTSCSLMTGGAALEEAVELARAHPTLAVGLHLTAVCGPALLRDAPWSPWVARSGEFSTNPAAAGFVMYVHPRQRALLRAEITAQFERFAATGLPLSHVDGHLHFHVHPVIFDLAVELAERYGAGGLRIPRDSLAVHRAAGGRVGLGEAALDRVFRVAGSRCLRRSAGRGLRVADRVWGLFQSDRVDTDYLAGLLAQVPDGLTEIYLHPDETGRGEQGRAELAALCSPRVRDLVAERGLALTTYAAG